MMGHNNGADRYRLWGEIGDWRDTFPAISMSSIRIRYALDTYGGNLVVHCHTLTHEDGGMMARIFVDDSDSGSDCLVSGGGETGKPFSYCETSNPNAVSSTPKSIYRECSSYGRSSNFRDDRDSDIGNPFPFGSVKSEYSELFLPSTVIVLMGLGVAFYYYIKRPRLSDRPS